MDTDKNTVQVSAIGYNEPGDKRTYTVLEIAAILRIGKSKAYELCDGEQFRIIRIGRSVRVSKTSFDEWLDNNLNDKGVNE
jgi:excisionase family DNA binding protein